jgi:aldose 1-epimerase
MSIARFGKMPDGTEIAEIVISAGDLTVSVINFGAVIRDVRLKGVDHPLVLGFDNIGDYVAHSPHFGAVAGRSANRIGKGRFTLDGRQVQLTLNEQGKTHLHGGFNGFGKRAWRLLEHDATSVTLAIAAEDGEEGYPGHVEVKVRYTVVAPGSIRMDAEAITDAPTLVNLAQHSYFNLDDSADILDHRLRILAEDYTPAGEDKVPTGEIAPVAGSDYDFRQMRPIRLVRNGQRVVYDLNYAAARAKSAAPRPMVRLESPKSRIALDVSSTEPGVQFYDGCMMNVPVPGLGDRRYPLNGGCCFEPQAYPDAPNHPNFPTSVLRPGETYRQTTLFAFSRI